MADQFFKHIYVGNIESINDIAKKNGVDIPLQQKMAVRGGKPLSFGKTTGGKIFQQLMLQLRTQFFRDPHQGRWKFDVVTAQEFPKAVRVNGNSVMVIVFDASTIAATKSSFAVE